MEFIKHIVLFMKNNIMLLKRKWLSLPLLFIFPILIVGIITYLIISFLIPDETDPIRVGLVDLDQSTETELVIQLMEESTQFGHYIVIEHMSEKEAKQGLQSNQIHTYLIFPENFTNDLYRGNSVVLPIIGNANYRTESMVINEIINSVARHIRSSQANILTINEYAKELNMNDEERMDLVFEQFKEFVFYTLGSSQIVDDQELINHATSSPIHYYGISGWFVIMTIWVLVIYLFLTRHNTTRLQERLKLYGITELKQQIAKVIVTLCVSFVFSLTAFFILQRGLAFELNTENNIRIAILMVLYILALLFCLAIIEAIFPSIRLMLFAQCLVTVILLFLSGAILPIIYLPLWIQEIAPLSFSYESFYWLTEILLNNRYFTDFIPILTISVAELFILISISGWKERVKA
ncbi:ABC transporter permease [Oceanobacillus piezotolerans]|uniref:ABC transporter permease n=1 Tax=Oceanobacillus piezotolerans TaxID=2448030 RepID=A0A498D9X4_9BACI|nr:ABC transporter permease [Oceanobacillus piezotolerans]RLL47914.1 ABC transporter permease [Oceanobacillus piezotolerans]